MLGEISDTMLRDIQLTLPSKTQKGQDLITPEYHTEHQLFILKAKSPVAGKNLVNEEEEIGKNLVNEEEEIGKSLGIDQGGKDNEPAMIRDLVEA